MLMNYHVQSASFDLCRYLRQLYNAFYFCFRDSLCNPITFLALAIFSLIPIVFSSILFYLILIKFFNSSFCQSDCLSIISAILF